MSFNIDPRGNLPPSQILPTSYVSRPAKPAREYHRHTTQAATTGHKSRRRTCYDWIFSSASNVHIAMDRSSFKKYSPYKSHVLALADQHQVEVLGVGTVVLNIRRQPGSKESHIVTLENVLHIPSWMCNVFSDVYFELATAFEHTWTEFGVSFMKKKDDGSGVRYWGFTEEFCGLERLVLAKDVRGRSPMLEDEDREVYSVNVTWPQGQRDRWEGSVKREEKAEKATAKLKEVDANTVPARRSLQIEMKA